VVADTLKEVVMKRLGGTLAVASLVLGLGAMLAMTVASTATARSPSGDPASPAAIAEMAAFNKAMRGLYADSRDRLLAESRPIILVGFDDVTLITNDGERSAPYTPPVYHHVKTVSHVVLGVVGAVSPWPTSERAIATWRGGLETVDARTAALLALVDDIGLSAESTARQRRILEASRRYVAAELARGKPDRAAFDAFMVEIKADWIANAVDAARGQLEMLHDVVTGWRSELSAEDWSRLHVLVLGPRMPRQGNLQVAYFARVLGEDAIDTRIIYAENIFAADPAMALLGVAVMDRHLSTLVFGDHLRMDRDLLSSAAQVILDELVGGR
jgi:hypothetical protein